MNCYLEAKVLSVQSVLTLADHEWLVEVYGKCQYPAAHWAGGRSLVNKVRTLLSVRPSDVSLSYISHLTVFKIILTDTYHSSDKWQSCRSADPSPVIL